MIAVWAITVLTVFAVYLGGIVGQKLLWMKRMDGRRQLELIAESGVLRAMAQLRADDKTPASDSFRDGWANNEEIFKDVAVGAGHFDVIQTGSDEQTVRYGLGDEESKICINTVGVDVLARMFEQAGLDDHEADALAYAVADWRDNDSLFQHPEYGAEDSEYGDLEVPYESKDAPFAVPEELLLVKGMTRDVFNKIKDIITVYSDGKVNINTVSGRVLSAHGLSAHLVEIVIEYRKGLDRLEGTEDDRYFDQPENVAAKISQVYDLGPGDVSELTTFMNTLNAGVVSQMFCARSVARLDRGGQEMEIRAVFDRRNKIFYWREEYRPSSYDRTKK